MRRLVVLLLALISLLPSCAGPDSRETLTQVSTLAALGAGDYEGKLTAARLLRYGDFGIGTFDALDGELVVLDGVAYRIDFEGKTRAVPPDALVAFAAVTFFDADGQTSFPGEIADAPRVVERLIDAQAGSASLILAVRIDGVFERVRVRSVAAQKKPYPPLADALKRQSVFDLKDVRGTLVGFRLPDLGEGVNQTGYHWHFITADRTAGGHVLDFTVGEVRAAFDVTPNFRLLLAKPVSAGHD